MTGMEQLDQQIATIERDLLLLKQMETPVLYITDGKAVQISIDGSHAERILRAHLNDLRERRATLAYRAEGYR
jgi:hypothetical protein